MNSPRKNLLKIFDVLYFSWSWQNDPLHYHFVGGHCGRDRMVVGFTTSYAISENHLVNFPHCIIDTIHLTPLFMWSRNYLLFMNIWVPSLLCGMCCSTFSVLCSILYFVDHCFSFCPFSFGHCIVCPVKYSFWFIPLLYLQIVPMLGWCCM